MKQTYCQEVLHDKQDCRRERPWAKTKLMNGFLAIAYEDVDPRKAERLRECATWLTFCRKEDGHLKLHKANFCRVRLCPVCAWRRSLKTFGQVRAVMQELGDSYSYIFLTLTMRNCSSSELSSEISHLGLSFNRLMKYKSVDTVVKGYFKALEVTHNIEADTYHPHLHIVFAVNKSYFTNRTYLSHDKWTSLWQKALQVSYTPIVDVRKVKGTADKAVAEISKYAVKSSEIICYDDWDLTVDTVRTLDKALENRRLTGYGGVFKDAHKRLHLDDNEDGDLTHVETEAVSEEDLPIVTYAWHTGYSQYILSM